MAQQMQLLIFLTTVVTFEFISKTGGEGGSKVDFSAKNDLAAKADAAASGSQVAGRHCVRRRRFKDQ